MRDLVRARAAAVETQRVHRQQVSGFMLKHGRVFTRPKAWTMRYLRWLQEQKFDHPAHQIALQEMVEAVRISKERVQRLEAAIEEFVPTWSLAPVVRGTRGGQVRLGQGGGRRGHRRTLAVGQASQSPLHPSPFPA